MNYELYEHWWDFFLVPVVFIYTLYSFFWVIEKSFTRFRAIGSILAVIVGYILLIGLVSGTAIRAWNYGYYNTPQNTPYTTHTGGIWHDSAGGSHIAPTEYTDHDENAKRRHVAGECSFMWGAIALCIFVALTDIIYLKRIRYQNGKNKSTSADSV